VNQSNLEKITNGDFENEIHTDSTVNKTNHILGLISKAFECKDLDIALKLYRSLLLEYNNAI